MILKVIISILAGLAAGVLTGFSGISAAVVITPALVSIVGFDAYEAVGIAMASDVIASAATAASYARHGHVRLKDALVMMIVVLCFVFVGSWASQFIPAPALGAVSVLITPVMGLRFLLVPQTNFNTLFGEQSRKLILIETLGAGMIIGFISGFAGAGGGEMMLMALSLILCYEVKDAVGTGVFIMTFIALVGCVTHFYYGGMPDLTALIICVLGNLLGAVSASRIANKTSSRTLNRIIGIMLVVIGLIMILAQWVF